MHWPCRPAFRKPEHSRSRRNVLRAGQEIGGDAPWGARRSCATYMRDGFEGGATIRPQELRETTVRMSIEQWIDNEVKSNDVVLFMKGTPQFPQCGFSGQVVQILDYLGVPYKGVNVLESDDLREGIKSYAQWPTIPQLYVKGEFLGGCDIVREMFQAGELQGVLKDKGVPVKAAAGA